MDEMRIIDYFQNDRQPHWLTQIASCEWRAAQYLGKLKRLQQI